MFKRITIIIACFQCFLTGCVNDKYYRTETGLLYKVLNVHNKNSIARIGQTVKLNYLQKVGDYLNVHNIKAVKSPDGTFIENLSEGSGMHIDFAKNISLNFSVSTLKGEKISSNIDTSSHQPGPANFVPGTGYLPSIVEDHLRGVKKGGRFKLYLLAVLIFGATPSSKDLKVGDDLVFELDVVDVKEKKVVQLLIMHIHFVPLTYV